MKWQADKARLLQKFKPKRYTTVVMMLIVWAGVMGSLFAAISTDIHNNDSLVGRAITVADSLPAQDLSTLKGNQSDLTNPIYVQMKERLQKVRTDNHDLAYVALMGQNAVGPFFYVNSENSASKLATNPGHPYADASLRLKQAFIANEPFIDAPHKDSNGIWVSAYAPIVNSKTKEVIGVASVNISAISFYEQVALYALIPLLLAAIPFLGLLRDRKLEGKEHEITELKNQFVSIASHELRSPLTGMLWAIQSLMHSAAGKLSIHDLEILGDMFRSTESSLATVNEILDLSIFERGQAEKLQHEKVDMITVTTEIIATLKLGAKEKHITIARTGTWPAHAYVIGDVAALKRAVMNILSNSIKYSQNGKTIALTYTFKDNEHIIAFHDQGIGIPEAEQEKVLQGYYRATNATQMQASGTGLGLWLSRMLVEQHNGKLWLRSQENKGTTVFIALPDDLLVP